MKSIKFKIKVAKSLTINIPERAMLKFPVHEHYLEELIDIDIIYRYKPTSKLKEAEYIHYLKHFLKQKYNAKIIEVSI